MQPATLSAGGGGGGENGWMESSLWALYWHKTKSKMLSTLLGFQIKSLWIICHRTTQHAYHTSHFFLHVALQPLWPRSSSLHVPHRLCFLMPVCPLGRLTAGHLASRTPVGNRLRLSSTSRPKITKGHCEFSCLEVLWPRKLSQDNDVRNSLSFLDYWRMYGTVFDVGPCPSGSDFAPTIAKWFVLIKSPHVNEAKQNNYTARDCSLVLPAWPQ